MALRAHSMIPSDLTPEQAFESDTGILHASSLSNPTLTVCYWITTRSILPCECREDGSCRYPVATVRVGSLNDDAWRMPVSDSNACSGVRLLGIVGWSRSAIVTAGAVGHRNWGKYVAGLEIHPLLPQRIRAITYRC